MRFQPCRPRHTILPVETRDLAELIRNHRPGHALARDFYTDPLIFELGAESVIVVRTSGGEIRALLNVCRHRGSRLCTGRSGKAQSARLTCPYHAWTYDLDGHLLVARQMPESFRRADGSLKTLPVRIMEGLIFATFATDPLD